MRERADLRRDRDPASLPRTRSLGSSRMRVYPKNHETEYRAAIKKYSHAGHPSGKPTFLGGPIRHSVPSASPLRRVRRRDRRPVIVTNAQTHGSCHKQSAVVRIREATAA